jgi:hypothetical protein
LFHLGHFTHIGWYSEDRIEARQVRFDQLIRPSMTVRDIRARFPQTAAVFEGLRFRESCDDCSVEVVCRKYGLKTQDIIEALNEAAFGASRNQADGRAQ